MKMINRFFAWYFGTLPQTIEANAATSLWFYFNYFAINRHLRYLFFPWKRMYAVRSKHGFDLSEWFYVWSFNLISRVLGMIVRLTTIFAGLVVLLFMAGFWIGVLGLWILGIVFLPAPLLYYMVYQLIHRPLQWKSILATPATLADWLAQQAAYTSIMRRSGLGTIQEGLALVAAQLPFLHLTKKERDSFNDNRSLATYAICKSLTAQAWWKQWLHDQGVTVGDFLEVISWEERVEKDRIKKARVWDRDNLSEIKAIGKDWSYGFTPTLDTYASDIRYLSNDPLIRNVRPEILEEMEQLFSKDKKTNILLVGDAGVGKHMLAYFLAIKIAEGKTTPLLADHRVMELDIDGVVAATQNQAQAIKLLDQIVNESISAGNIILVINDFDRYVADDFHSMDLSGVFKRVKDSNRLKLLGLVSSAQFSSKVVPNRSLYAAMEVIQVKATTPAQTLTILENLATHYEHTRRIMIQLPALREIIARGGDVMTHLPFPDKGVMLLDECVSLAVSQQQAIVDRLLVDKTLSLRTGIPTGIWDNTYRQKLIQMEDFLHQRVIGQNPAIAEIAKAIRRASVGLAGKDKTMGALLFLGTTGVGKTETAKALAELFFGSKEALVRIDLGEYSEAAALRNLVGAPAGEEQHNQGGQLTEAVRQKPYSVVLFDEIEKAHPSILNAILTVFDEGYLTDAKGEKISFRHTIVIATSNAAADLVKTLLIDERQTIAQATPQVIDALITRKIFLPEFINRFDRIVLYQPLTKKEVKAITKLKLKTLAAEIDADQGITITISDDLIEDLAKNGFNEQFGGRYLERHLTERVHDVVAQSILEGKVKRGGSLRL